MKRKDTKAMGRTAEDGEESDRIGRLGESRFDLLCNDAKLFCNKFTVDRTGKDFVVEHPLDKINNFVSYDKRGEPKKYIFQVKTVGKGSRSVSISLSSAERLIKEACPTVICVFSYDKSTDRLDHMVFIHIIDDVIAKVLRRLRMEYKRGNQRLHKATISIPIPGARKLQIEKEVLLQELDKLGIPTMEAYALKKREQVKTLGFDEHRYTMKMTFEAADQQELTDGFLGLRELKVAHAHAEEFRFAIGLPAPDLFHGFEKGTVFITPEPVGSGRLAIVESDGTTPFAALVKVVGVPGGEVGVEPTLLFQWSAGYVQIKYIKKLLNVTLKPSKSDIASSQTFIDEYRFMRRLLDSPAQLIYEDARGTVSLGTIDWPQKDDDLSIRRIARMLDWYDGIYSTAGDYPNEISIERLWQTRREAKILYEMVTKNVRFQTTSEIWEMEEIDNARGQYVTAIELAGLWYGIGIPLSVSTQAATEKRNWIGIKAGEVHIERFNGDVDNKFPNFREKIIKLSSSQCSFIQDPETFLKDNGTIEIRQ
ncbi:hypothetical protein [Allomesorhizobium camelthorni]|uniref:DUF4365 domain-containing protein n=1 Tax=Allomesorhizobium camelthorni TaxID=475069 RepID=A0A6G4WKV9_9HYPH|nr:hypothetical protein [Mesorhizobium camelthorni]NGO54750.1 hypothetical protein [Mesorhizobium camelthorni]